MFSFTRYIAAIAILLSLWIGPAWSQDGMVAIDGNTPPSLDRATFVKHSDPNGVMKIVVGLKMRNEQDLDDLITRQQDSASPDYHRFIIPADFADRFAPAQSDVANVSSYLESQGFSVLQVTPNRMLIQARGTVGQIEQAFQVSINDYDFNEKRHFNNDRDPSVPANLRNVVRSIGGLSSLGNRHSMVVPGALAPTVIFTPQQIAKAYHYPNVLTKPIKPPYDGSGVTIAIATAFSLSPQPVALRSPSTAQEPVLQSVPGRFLEEEFRRYFRFPPGSPDMCRPPIGAVRPISPSTLTRTPLTTLISRDDGDIRVAPVLLAPTGRHCGRLAFRQSKDIARERQLLFSTSLPRRAFITSTCMTSRRGTMVAVSVPATRQGKTGTIPLAGALPTEPI